MALKPLKKNKMTKYCDILNIPANNITINHKCIKSNQLKEPNLQEELFIDFLEKNKGLIVKVAGVYCYDHDERRDLIQDIILQLWRSFPKFDSSSSISTWTYRIALNVSISYLRKMTTRKKTHAIYQQQTEFIQWDAPAIDERLE
jgi:RNA polymerase sigma-70 factor (ECF subfamily)